MSVSVLETLLPVVPLCHWGRERWRDEGEERPREREFRGERLWGDKRRGARETERSRDKKGGEESEEMRNGGT